MSMLRVKYECEKCGQTFPYDERVAKQGTSVMVPKKYCTMCDPQFETVTLIKNANGWTCKVCGKYVTAHSHHEYMDVYCTTCGWVVATTNQLWNALSAKPVIDLPRLKPQ
jgi:predicted RNA-binding Zn-ribbon protein involved in translation (DUF1610 family)